jgi:hypothetical protein
MPVINMAQRLVPYIPNGSSGGDGISINLGG